MVKTKVWVYFEKGRAYIRTANASLRIPAGYRMKFRGHETSCGILPESEEMHLPFGCMHVLSRNTPKPLFSPFFYASLCLFQKQKIRYRYLRSTETDSMF